MFENDSDSDPNRRVRADQGLNSYCQQFFDFYVLYIGTSRNAKYNTYSQQEFEFEFEFKE